MNNCDRMKLIEETYLNHHKEHIFTHVKEVAETAAWLAKAQHLDTKKVRLAALLHDISGIMTPQEMYALAVKRGMEMDAAEEKYPFLLHQRISRIIAEETFDIQDKDVLQAIECHTTLKKKASLYDKVIFLADKISWDQKGKPPYYDLIMERLNESLDAACYGFLQYQFDNHLLLMPHKWIIEAYADLKEAERAGMEDIPSLTELRLAYLTEDYGALSEKVTMQLKQDLPLYFEKHLNRDIFCYLVKEQEENIACAFLLVTEKPASPMFLTGKTGLVLNVYTKPAHRKMGFGKKVMEALLRDAKEMQLSSVELKATDAGYPLYKAVGFVDDESKYHKMKWHNET